MWSLPLCARFSPTRSRNHERVCAYIHNAPKSPQGTHICEMDYRISLPQRLNRTPAPRVGTGALGKRWRGSGASQQTLQRKTCVKATHTSWWVQVVDCSRRRRPRSPIPVFRPQRTRCPPWRILSRSWDPDLDVATGLKIVIGGPAIAGLKQLGDSSTGAGVHPVPSQLPPTDVHTDSDTTALSDVMSTEAAPASNPLL